MVGAIDFLRAWRTVCGSYDRCKDCPLEAECVDTDAFGLTDGQINSLVRKTMAEGRKRDIPFLAEPSEDEEFY